MLGGTIPFAIYTALSSVLDLSTRRPNFVSDKFTANPQLFTVGVDKLSISKISFTNSFCKELILAGSGRVSDSYPYTTYTSSYR